MIKSDFDQAIDDERRKTGTTLVSTAEKTRYENLALQDISSKVDLDGQETIADFTFLPGSGISAVNALSAVAPDLKDRKAIIGIVALSSYSNKYSHVRPEEFDFLPSGNFWAVSGNDLWVKADSASGDTLRVRYYANYVAKTSAGSLSGSMTTASDEPLLDNAEQEAIIQFALGKIFSKEGKKDDKKSALDRYQEILKIIGEKNESRRSRIYDRQTVEDVIDSDWMTRTSRP